MANGHIYGGPVKRKGRKMARRPQGSVRRSPRLKQGKPKPPGVGRPSPRPKRSTGPVGGPKPKSKINPQKPKGFPDRFKRKLDRSPTVQGSAMGGQASESVARSKIVKDQRKRQQDKLNRMLERLYGKQKIVPKKKPKKDK